MTEIADAPFVARNGSTDGAGTGMEITGMESPRQLADAMPMVERAFVFVDLCGFTEFMATRGEHAAIDALTAFRNLTRDIATRRGVRIASWLGDGAMLIGTEVGPAVAAAAELIARYDSNTLALRGGIADGWALLFDGDDYIGRPVNLAARLSQAARPGELLAIGYRAETFPSWMQVLGTRDLTLRGLGRFRRVQRLGLVPGTELPALSFVSTPRVTEPISVTPARWRNLAGVLIAVLAGVVAVAAAIRSTWSPCGQSMLSTITPLGEQGRGNRFRTTAVWFIAGATLGGATLGLGAALLAAGVRALGISAAAALGIAVVLAIAAAVADAGLFGIHVPYHRRQVNELWLDDYRSWVYGGGFGFQIGIGFATYIMTSALLLLVVLVALTGNPLVALAIGTLFGFARGLGVLPGARLTTPAKLVEFHQRFDAESAASRRLVIAIEIVVAIVTAVAVGGVVAGAAVAGVLVVLFALARRSDTARTHRRDLVSS